MKVILSRKGFDSSSGGVPSPIFPDRRMISLPIPDNHSSISYGEIYHDNRSLGDLVEGLTGGRIGSCSGAHIDPDLQSESLPRQPGWQPVFGQKGQAQSHLRNNHIGPGDLFLFFGLFRRVTNCSPDCTWLTEARPCHVIWGWLQIAEVLDLSDGLPQGYDWAAYHPHCHGRAEPNNVIYIGQHHLQIDGLAETLPGAGTFSHFSPGRQLTASQAKQLSVWRLPDWFHPGKNRKPLTYHGDPKRWQKQFGGTTLKSVARGQEFVLDCDDYPEALPWVSEMIRNRDNDC